MSIFRALQQRTVKTSSHPNVTVNDQGQAQDGVDDRVLAASGHICCRGDRHQRRTQKPLERPVVRAMGP